MKETSIPTIDFQQIKAINQVEYNDGDIALITDLRELPMNELPIALNMFLLLICEQGKFQVEINNTPYSVNRNTILFYKPQELLDNCMISPDFRGKILCLSHRVLMDSFSDSDFWDRGINLLTQRAVPVDEESIHLYNLFGELLQAKVKQPKPLFKKEIIHSLIRAAIYELLSSFKSSGRAYGKGLVKQSEVLFQRFLNLLSGLRVKPLSGVPCTSQSACEALPAEESR